MNSDCDEHDAEWCLTLGEMRCSFSCVGIWSEDRYKCGCPGTLIITTICFSSPCRYTSTPTSAGWTAIEQHGKHGNHHGPFICLLSFRVNHTWCDVKLTLCVFSVWLWAVCVSQREREQDCVISVTNNVTDNVTSNVTSNVTNNVTKWQTMCSCVCVCVMVNRL